MIFKRIKKFYRLLHINSVLVHHGVDRFIYTSKWLLPLKFFNFLNLYHWRYDQSYSRGQRLRHALEELGPIFVKFGQMLSTRRDLLPADIADELALLQDQVPPFSGDVATTIIEKAYNKSLSQLFLEFDSTPLASASIAQVHAAKLPDGKDVIIKILRPNITKVIVRDISLIYGFVKIAERFWPGGRRLRLSDVVIEFEQCMLDELDLLREAANASQLRRNFKNSAKLYVPEIFWPYVRQNVMVMERIYGIRVSDFDELERQHFNFKKLAETGVEILFTQIFRDSFFHADMHPGNIFIHPNNPQEPQFVMIDFGIVGTLNRNDQHYLAENFLAFFKRDYRRVAELHIESGWVPHHTRVDAFESAIRTVCEPIFERPLKDISCGQVLLRLFQTARRFHMEILPQLTLLQKTILNVEGLGRQLYPELDLWSTARPFLEKWVKQQIGIKAALRKISVRGPFWAEKLPEIPDLVYNALRFADDLKHQRHEQEIRVMRTKLITRHRKWQGFLSGVSITLLFVIGLNYSIKEHLIASNLFWPILASTLCATILALVINIK